MVKPVEISTEKGERMVDVLPSKKEIIVSRRYKGEWVEISPRQFNEIVELLKSRGTISGKLISMELKKAYRDGIRAAASFAGTWDKHITGTPHRFEDVILGKFGLLQKNKMRKKKP